ncbi:acetyl-CoA carboxylase biotin carboxylase subunit [Pseudarthrobacter sp. BIM B-2242]|uniref:acetyl-CoA carboxylase biotin carboxylase subunit n=1 Tax=Pseudarthrobacter sp. BIM B-2242 TaxID=2772401 RepID=UPI00168A4DF9|nr:acetyl-CoA carboxylase biotin carboxylase subunit [Pseudarthrobacter sp. BIM B-2242]QOD02711.1 acetyl-CoA carboxylase biotin carboxylase subunit [Pseudarthrobacter sp. BIM B-2242]
MFTKILIANRGEISVRVSRSCRAMGIESVAVYSAADAGSLHVRVADAAINLGDGPASENYLNIPKIIAAALESGAQAIHPGYGFLSENPEFAEAVAAAGLTFIGPSPHAITTMGGKVAARDVAIRVQVPLAPGTDGAIASAAEVEAFGAEHGYPVLVKASAGGGGRGMRRIDSEPQAREAFDAAVREATAAFGNGEVYLERYLTHARHVEVQVFADTHGNAVYVGDRDCSVQRRHQKLIEESPAPGLSDALRAAMGESAVRLAREVGYVGAGTVEFLVEDEKFYFLEMNTRIQVEHPVTEMVHGVDLIAEQIRVAAGEKLSILNNLKPQGAAIEARINAEDVAEGRFLPAPGPVQVLNAPDGEGLRFDAGYESGDTVLPFYDSLIGKLIAYGPDRATAMKRLLDGLDRLQVEGVPTTAPAAKIIVSHPDFQELRFSTLWLEESVDFTEPEPVDRANVEVGGRFYIIPTFSDYGTAGGYGSAVAAGGADTAPGDPAAAVGKTRQARARREVVSDGTVKAPMQGTIIKINVTPGQKVAKGDVMFVLEAMKMENPIAAPVAGVVGDITASIGESLAAGTLLTKVTEEAAA